MKSRLLAVSALSLLLVNVTACKPKPAVTTAPKQASEAAQEDSEPDTGQRPATLREEIQTVVDGVTGIQAVEKGEEMKQKLRRIDDDRQKQMEEYGDF
jgi:hypothetical protein